MASYSRVLILLGLLALLTALIDPCAAKGNHRQKKKSRSKPKQRTHDKHRPTRNRTKSSLERSGIVGDGLLDVIGIGFVDPFAPSPEIMQGDVLFEKVNHSTPNEELAVFFPIILSKTLNARSEFSLKGDVENGWGNLLKDLLLN